MDHETDFYWLVVIVNWRLTCLRLTMQCVAPVPRNCVSQLACVLPLRHWPNALRSWSMADLNFGVLYWSNALRIWPGARSWSNVAHLVKCRAFCQLVRCAAHLTKCANWSNAPYTVTVNTRLMLPHSSEFYSAVILLSSLLMCRSWPPPMHRHK